VRTALALTLSPFRASRRWFVGFSGGVDSTVLLHALAHLPEGPWPEITAVHINHQLQSAANDWEQHCQQQAAGLGVGFRTIRVTVAGSANREAEARKARYAAFASLLEEGDCLLLAHHQQDQAETLLYRLFRGAGVRGLSAMQRVTLLERGTLVRPLLDLPRRAVLAYAGESGLRYVDDPSNVDVGYDRNYLRHRLVPVIEARWPSAGAALSRAARHLQEASLLLDELAAIDLSSCEQRDDAEPWIDLSGISLLSLSRQKNLLRYWLEKKGVVLAEEQQRVLQEEFLLAAEDRQPCLVNGEKTLRRFRGRLYVTSARPVAWSDPISWHGLGVCHIPGYGRLALSPPQDLALTVEPRRGGEVVKPEGSAHTRTVKNLLHESQIPPWQREQIPLVFLDGEIVAVADLFHAEGALDKLRGSRVVRVL
jgi:tRNA(Ile)-lysidine synthase